MYLVVACSHQGQEARRGEKRNAKGVNKQARIIFLRGLRALRGEYSGIPAHFFGRETCALSAVADDHSEKIRAVTLQLGLANAIDLQQLP